MPFKIILFLHRIAAYHVGTLGMLLTACPNMWRSWPIYLQWLSWLSPFPVGQTADLWIYDNCLSPDYSGLVCSTFCRLLESSSGWWNRIISSLLAGKEIQPCLVHTCGWILSAIHKYNKGLQILHIILWNLCGSVAKPNEGFRNFFANTPCHPWREFPFHWTQMYRSL